MKITDGMSPICTAPKDGRLIIVADDDAGAFKMRWDAEATNPLVGDHKGLWVSEGKDFTWDESRGCGPSFWREIQ